MRALVTGASGFIGSHLARRLLREGWEVTLVTRPSSRIGDDLAATCPVISTEQGPEEFTRGVQATMPDVCFHLATHFAAVHGPGDLHPLVASNLELGLLLADALSRAGDTAFVNVGTVWQHHDGRRYGPSSLYAATKQAFADLLQFFAECTALRVVTVELSDTYGPGDSRPKLPGLLARAVAEGQPIEMSPGDQLVSYTHVDDVVGALLHAVRYAGSEAPTFSVPGWTMTLRRFVDLVGEVLGSPVPVAWGAREYRPREMMSPWTYSPSLPGWTPQVGLRAGLADVLPRLNRRPGTARPR